jgi:hypothetical protein
MIIHTINHHMAVADRAGEDVDRFNIKALCGKGSEPLLMEDLDVRCALRVSQDLRCLAIIHKPSAFFDPMFHCWIDLVIAAGAHARSTDSMQLACASRLLREIRP